jgi:hypothetical protein
MKTSPVYLKYLRREYLMVHFGEKFHHDSELYVCILTPFIDFDETPCTPCRLCARFETHCIRGCIHKFPDWPPGARTANATDPFH